MTELAAKVPSDSHVEMTEIVLPHHTNAIGTVFGGTVMCWVDIAAASCGLRHCRKQVVTASVDAMHFLAPISLGWIVTIRASVNYTSRTSCEIGVKVISENPFTAETFHTSSAYLTMVALGEDGRPAEIPSISPQTEEEHHRFDAAIRRRENRLALKDELKKRRADKRKG